MIAAAWSFFMLRFVFMGCAYKIYYFTNSCTELSTAKGEGGAQHEVVTDPPLTTRDGQPRPWGGTHRGIPHGAGRSRHWQSRRCYGFFCLEAIPSRSRLMTNASKSPLAAQPLVSGRPDGKLCSQAIGLPLRRANAKYSRARHRKPTVNRAPLATWRPTRQLTSLPIYPS